MGMNPSYRGLSGLPVNHVPPQGSRGPEAWMMPFRKLAKVFSDSHPEKMDTGPGISRTVSTSRRSQSKVSHEGSVSIASGIMASTWGPN